MMHHCMRLCGAAILFAALLACRGPELTQETAVEPSRGNHAFVGANVIPMTGDSGLLPDQTVLVRGGVIEAIGHRADVTIPSDFRRIDATGQYLIPGLVDMHVHLEHFRSPEVLKLFVANGVVAIRNMDGRPYILQWRESVRNGSMIGPTIYTAGPILDGDPPLLDDNTVVRNAMEAAAAVRDQARTGYDFIKVYTNLSEEAYRAILSEAREQGLAVAGHVPRRVPVTVAFEAGQVSIEHLDGYDELIEAEDSPHRDGWHWSKLYLAMPADPAKIPAAAAGAARARVWNVPTLVQSGKVNAPDVMRSWLSEPTMAYVPGNLRRYWAPENRDPYSRRLLEGFGDEELEILQRGRENRSRMVLALHEAGAGLLVGTDTPNPFVVPGFSIHEELENFVHAGLDPLEALAAATHDAARFLGSLNAFGTIEEGKQAQLVLLRANPVEAIANTRSIAGVMVGGAWLSEEQLEVLLREVASAYR
ncbi:MAG TPA: amidohydrolase family protein [Thermoanaerobaculia bacterium]|nr:amidohydrolase family protein [Thermoanaerobaculia bacterium]